ncbi:hypothetical protein B0H66DRAFT_357041 [Apodospora peruviana]|uniref:NB-ARC domain-containing protein n=1 Tax=Apodospora peruviana TaxID=516989 RepID=A0AAE0HVD4_9PEZI|nr:hypothetical protein B0H66DRAFT_357041 [Apodospora peruviana]
MNPWGSRKTAPDAPPPGASPPSRTSSGTSELDSGLQPVYHGEGSASETVDFVAVHGLNGHREKTWTTKSGVNWLRDLLPVDFPNSRILSYGYNSRTHGSDQLIENSLYEHAISFLTELCNYRRNTKTERRPIILLAHSLGGIVVKAALIHSNLCKADRKLEANIKLSTHAVVFFGTPHSGSHAAAVGTHVLTLGSIFVRTNTRIIRQLRENSDFLGVQRDQWKAISSNFEITEFYETYRTIVLFGRGLMVVPSQSATQAGSSTGQPLHRCHRELVRFESRLDPDYITISSQLKDLVSRSHDTIAANWDISEGANTSPGFASSSRVSSFASTVDPATSPTTPTARMSTTLRFSLPVEQNPGFVGRAGHLKELHKYLWTVNESGFGVGERSRIVVLHGLGGAGKTQLSIAYAQHHKKDFSAVFWIDASTERNTLLSYRIIAQRLLETTTGHPGHEDDARKSLLSRLPIGEYVSSSGQLSPDDKALPKIAKAAVDFLQSENESFSWLMIMDNLDSLDDYPLSTYLPQNSKRGKVIITTRLRAAAQLKNMHHIETDQIEEADGVQILLNAAPLRIKSETDDQDAKAIANALGLLPLALELAGAYINKAQMQLSRYLELFERHRNQLGRFGDQAAVFATWEVSFQRLAEDSDAAELLTLLAFLHNSTFWEGLLLIPFDDDDAVATESSALGSAWLRELSADELRLMNALIKIFSISLAKRNSDGTVYLHPLVHYFGRERLSGDKRREKLIQAVIVVGKALQQAYTRPMTKEVRKFISRIVPHADHCIFLVNQEGAKDIFATMLTDKAAAKALFYLGVLFQNLSRLKEAETIFAAIATTTHPDSCCTPHMGANSERRLAQVMILFSRYQEAEVLLLNAIPILTGLVGKRHDDAIAAQLALGMVYHRRHQYSDAERLLREAISNGTDESPNRRPVMGRLAREAASVLGLVYRDQGRLQEALDILSEALKQASEMEEEEDEDDAAHLPTVRYRHAIILQDLGHWITAMHTYAEIWGQLKVILGPGNPLTLRTANALGRMYCFLGRYREARDMLDIAWRGQEALGFSRDQETAQLRTLFNIGVLNMEEGLYSEAVECLSRVQRAYTKLYDSDAMLTHTAFLELGIVHSRRGKPAEAVTLLERLLESQLAHHPDSRMELCQTRIALAEALTQVPGSVEQAKMVLTPALEFARSSLEPDNPVRLKVELAHANRVLACGPQQQDEPLVLDDLRDVVARLERIFGLRHQTTVRGKVLLAMAYEHVAGEEVAKAREMMQEAAETLKASLGPGHPLSKEIAKMARSREKAAATECDVDDDAVKGGNGKTTPAKFDVRVSVRQLGEAMQELRFGS